MNPLFFKFDDFVLEAFERLLICTYEMEQIPCAILPSTQQTLKCCHVNEIIGVLVLSSAHNSSNETLTKS